MRYLVRKLFFYLIAAWVAITLNFFIPHLMPGNPAGIAISRYQGTLTPQGLAALTQLFGISKAPLYTQYWQYLDHLAHGNLGTSLYYFPTPVTTIIAQRLPWTLVLVGLATIASFILGTFLGILAGWKRNSWVDTLVPTGTFLSGIPYYWLALLAIWLLAEKAGILPLGSGYSATAVPGWNFSFIGDAIVHGILPALTILLTAIGGWMVGMRNQMITTLGEDYLTLARAKGLRSRRIMFAYAARNAILPNVASFAIALGLIVGGAIFTEIVFSYPGIGYTLYLAVENEDYPLMQALFLLISLTVLLANFLVDIAYAYIDPRAKLAEQGTA
jgi:peptide/nickel transport system permease protein